MRDIVHEPAASYQRHSFFAVREIITLRQRFQNGVSC